LGFAAVAGSVGAATANANASPTASAVERKIFFIN
jgi:hypothetical protein